MRYSHRVAKTDGSNPSETIYFEGQAIALHNSSSDAWTNLIWANGSIIVEVAGPRTATLEYRLDHLGSLVVQTNNSETVTGAKVFLPFGVLVSTTTSDSFQFAGLQQAFGFSLSTPTIS